MPDTETIDWDELRALSLRPGGFGEDRVRIWTALLHANALPSASTASSSTNGAGTASPPGSAAPSDDDTEPHRDERQIRLDTDRSFVMYPHTASGARDPLQLDLYRLLVSVFRRRRKLHYFQGYHDIITVLFLTLPPELHLRAAEHLSLHRLRDSMGPSLEPVLALLRILKNLLRLADPQLADILESTSPLPYHALPALLTLLAHDTPTLPLIQHIFDWLLCRPPEAVVWLVAALILSRKPAVLALEEEGEEGMVHSLLSSMPELCDDVIEPGGGEREGVREEGDETREWVRKDVEDETREEAREEVEDGTREGARKEVEDETREGVREEVEDETRKGAREGRRDEAVGGVQSDDEVTMCDTGDADTTGCDGDTTMGDGDTTVGDGDTTVGDGETTECGDDTTVCGDETSSSRRATPEPKPDRPPHPISSRSNAGTDKDAKTRQPGRAFTAPHNPGGDPTTSGAPPVPNAEDSHPILPSPDAPPPRTPTPKSTVSRPQKLPVLSLPELLTHASTLLHTFPPTHPALGIATLLGPASVVHTWRADQSTQTETQTDDALEDLVTHPELVVVPYVEPTPKPQRTLQPRKKTRLRLRLPLATVHLQRRTIIAVLVLGVAVAVYGARTRGAAGWGRGALGMVCGWFVDGLGSGIVGGLGSGVVGAG